MDIKSLYIIKLKTGTCLYYKDFTESTIDPHLVASLLVAIMSFFDMSKQSEVSTARGFEGSDYKIMVEFGEWTLGALSVSNENEFLRKCLRRVIEKFEQQFSLLKHVDIDLAVRTRFEQVVIDEFIRPQINEDTIIRPRLNWDLYVDNAEVRAFLSLLPKNCSVREASEFLEIPIDTVINLTARSLWEKAILVLQPIRPDDIYQATSILQPNSGVPDVSEDTVRAIPELDGETPLSIAAERIKTSDFSKFLTEIGILAQRKAVERVSPSQARLVLYTAVVQTLVEGFSKMAGMSAARRIFFDSRNELSGPHPWLAFVDIEQGITVDIKGSLLAAALRGILSPDAIEEGFRALLQFLSKRMSRIVGRNVTNRLVELTRDSIEERYPSAVYEVGWDTLTVV